MAQDEAVRVTGEAIVVSLYPDVCLTPSGGGMVPVPYTITARFDQSIRQRPTVRFRGLEAMTDFGRITRVFGDEPGVGGGIQSGVNMGMCRPQTYSSTVRINGQHVVRHTSLIEMNCAGPDGPHNTLGAVAYPIAVPAACMINASGEIEGDPDPPVEPETEEEGGWLDWVQGGLDVAGLVPGLGEIADGANALISLGRGNYVEAGLSAAAMIPFAGWGATGAKAGLKYGDEVLQHGDEAVDAVQAARRTGDEAGAATARTGDDGVVVTGQERTAPELLPGEGDVGTYGDLRRAGTRGDNITPHHMPSDSYMRNHQTDGSPTFPGYTRDGGVSMNMEQPHPGTGGRHRRTSTYGSSPDLSVSPRDALARDIRDARRIYQQDGLYNPTMRSNLQEVIRQNREAWPEAFGRSNRLR